MHVEKHYGKRVREDVVDLPQERIAYSIVEVDGTPVVQINSSTQPSEHTIIHELFHLKMEADGYAVLAYNPPPNQDREQFRRLMETWIHPYVRDTILHSLFYSAMRQMGLEPATELRAKVERFILEDRMDGNFEKSATGTQMLMIVLTYYKAALELDDGKLTDRLSQWYQKKAWGDQLRIAQNLLQIVRSSAPNSPESVVESFLKCMEYLLGWKYTIQKWETKTLGIHKQQVVLINVQ